MLTIDENIVKVESIWAHLKNPIGRDCVAYHLGIPYEIAHIVLGSEKPNGLSWLDYVRGNIREFGTFIVDGYVASLTRLANKNRGPFQWVIMSVDDVSDESGFICLTGKAERFYPKLGISELKPLK